MPASIVTYPAAEPITLAEAKLHLRVDVTDDDALISALITAARQTAETITRRALVTQTWKLVLDRFPMPGMNISSANWYGPQWGIGPGPLSVTSPEGRTGFEIYLPNPPIQSVDAIKYIDATTGTQITLDPATYILDNVSEPARVVPAYSQTWPATRNQVNSVEVDFTCGYGDATAVPEGIKSWIKIRVGTLYANREEVAILNRGKVEDLPYVDSLLDPFRVVTY